MSAATGIEWTDATWNPTRGCSRVSEGCRNCYAERVAARFSKPGMPYDGIAKVVAPRDLLDRVGGRRNGWTGVVRLIADTLPAPLRWRKPKRIFVNSMSDLFHEKLTNEEIAAVFGVMAACPQHTFQVLTKRAKRMRAWFAWARDHLADFAEITVTALGEDGYDYGDGAMFVPETWPLRNVWLGVSVENQEAADERIPELLATPSAVRFLSCEPLIGEVDLHAIQIPDADRGLRFSALQHQHDDRFGQSDTIIDWVIAGCESGPGARSCATAWLRSLRDQCDESGTAFFLKQAHPAVWAKGEKVPGHGKDDGAGAISCGPRSTRKGGGVIGAPYLDGKQHLAFPKAA